MSKEIREKMLIIRYDELINKIHQETCNDNRYYSNMIDLMMANYNSIKNVEELIKELKEVHEELIHVYKFE